MTPGVYDMPAEQYHRDPAPAPSLSASIAQTLLDKSPRHAWLDHPRLNPSAEHENKAEFDIGNAAHSLILGDAKNFALLDFEDYRKQAARDARDAAYAAGKIPLLAAQWERVNAMVAAARAQLAVHEDAAGAFAAGTPEQTLIWQEGDIWCRCRLDWLPLKGRDFYDFKTTSDTANPETLERRIYGTGADVQAAFYRRGIRAVLKIAEPQFHFVVCETTEPYALSVAGLSPRAVDLGDRKVAEAIRWWSWCLKNNSWPGYPARTVYIDPPAYSEYRWAERETREALMKERGDEAAFRAVMDWMRPNP